MKRQTTRDRIRHALAEGDMALTEIASVLSVPIGTVRQALLRMQQYGEVFPHWISRTGTVGRSSYMYSLKAAGPMPIGNCRAQSLARIALRIRRLVKKTEEVAVFVSSQGDISALTKPCDGYEKVIDRLGRDLVGIYRHPVISAHLIEDIRFHLDFSLR